MSIVFSLLLSVLSFSQPSIFGDWIEFKTTCSDGNYIYEVAEEDFCSIKYLEGNRIDVKCSDVAYSGSFQLSGDQLIETFSGFVSDPATLNFVSAKEMTHSYKSSERSVCHPHDTVVHFRKK